MPNFRCLTLAMACMFLAGCNYVYSEEPWFSASDEAGAPRLRDGLWVVSNTDTRCRFDKEKPAYRWPECAGDFVVRGDQTLTYGDGNPGAWRSEQLTLATGDPRILQSANQEDPEEGVTESGQVDQPTRFEYLGLRPLLSRDGKDIVGFVAWPVVCGPLDQKDKDAERSVTRAPFAGLTIVENSCTANDVQALRNAARESETVGRKNGESQITAHWVRSTWP